MKNLKYGAYFFWGIALFGGLEGDFTFGGLLTLVVIGVLFYFLPKFLTPSSESSKDEDVTHVIKIDGLKFKRGEYEKNISDGIRTLEYEDGMIYEGDVVDGFKSGKGTQKQPDGDKYIGEFKKDQYHGYGKYLWSESNETEESYEGDFYEGDFRGFGTMVYRNGDKYEGEYKKDLRNGKGKFTWNSGEVYDGEWYDGQRHGMGTESFPDGTYWKGEYIKNEKYKGKWYYPKKKKVERNPEKRVPHEIPEDRHRIINEDAEWHGNGSGVFISKSGYLVTNNHVIQDASKVSAEFIYNNEIEIFKVKIIRVDEANDLAILKIDDKKFKGFKSLPYSIKKSTCDVGTEVYALGYPMALSLLGKDLKFTDGKISAKSGFQGDIRQYQTTVPIQGGNSGGPLFDINGNLVGINSSKIRQDVADNVSYAIKSDYLITLINAMPQKIPLPNSRSLNGKKQTEQIKKLSDFVPLIKVA